MKIVDPIAKITTLRARLDVLVGSSFLVYDSSLRWCRDLLPLVCCTWFVAMPAAAHDGFGGFDAEFLGAAGGAGLGLLAGLALALVLAVAGRLQGLSSLVFWVVVPFTGAIVGSMVAIAVDFRPGQDERDRQARQLEDFQADPLRLAACKGSAGEVERIVAAGASPRSLGFLPAIVDQCLVGSRERDEHFTALIPLLSRMQRTADETAHFCGVLHFIHRAHRSDLLRKIADVGLPIECAPDKDGTPVWFGGASADARTWIASAPDRQAAMLEWLKFLQSQGVDLGVRGGGYGECLLDRVIESHPAEMVLMALEAGCDPTSLPSSPHGEAAVAKWVERRFRSLHGCSYGTPLSQGQISEIDARMPEITAATINHPQKANGQTLLYMVGQMRQCDDGGAAAFSYLVAHGADLGLASGVIGDAGFLGGMPGLHPALAAELRKLDRAQIRRMAFPVSTWQGRRTTRLLDSARASGNLALVEILCAHGIEGCR